MRIINKVNTTYEFNSLTYPVEIIYKTPKKTISYRYRDGKFIVSSPKNVSIKHILKQLDNYAEKLIKTEVGVIPPFGDNYVYVLGNKINTEKGKIEFNNRKPIYFKNEDELKKELKKLLLEITTSLSAYYEKVMKTNTHYRVHVREMKTRYGSNSRKTNFFTYNTCLIHYDYEIIKSVVVHEVAHCLQFDHSKKFYDIVKKALPEYDILHTKLRKGIYK